MNVPPGPAQQPLHPSGNTGPLHPGAACTFDYLDGYGVTVVDSISLGIADNVAVGRLDPFDLVRLADQLDLADADAIVLSACVQMPSLPAVPIVEQRCALPVLTAPPR